MSTAKLVTLGVVGMLAWQNQAAVADRLEPLREAVPRIRSYMEMRSYSNELGLHIERNGGPPRELRDWIDQRFPPKGGRPASSDHFGNPYRVDRDRTHGWVLRSCGADGVCLSGDDLIMPLVDRSRRRTVGLPPADGRPPLHAPGEGGILQVSAV